MDGEDEMNGFITSFFLNNDNIRSKMENSARVAVFIDTNIGTHFAISISPQVSVPHLKRELESSHLACFPNLGGIKVNSIMVKRKSHLYYLSESFPLKYAFLDITRAYFFFIEVCHHISSENVGLSECISKKEPNTRAVSHTRGKHKCKRMKRKFKSKCVEKDFAPLHGLGSDRDFSRLDETPSDTSSVSVSGIIEKYFANSGKLTSKSEGNFAGMRRWTEEELKFRRYDDNTPPKCSATTPPSGSIGVGKRLVNASNMLRIAQSQRKPSISPCSRFLNASKSSLERSLVFEIH